jgi:hypothetical protein
MPVTHRAVDARFSLPANTKLGTTVLTEYGTKRGGVALGRMLPFGLGATIGGGVNFVMTKKRFQNSVGPCMACWKVSLSIRIQPFELN